MQDKIKPSERPGVDASGADPLTRLSQPDKAERSHLAARLRNYFLTGIVVAGPIAITVYVVRWFVTSIDDWVKPFLPSIYNPETYLLFHLPGTGLVIAIVALTLFGALAANLIGRTVVSYSELMVERMPVVRNVYRGLKQIFETVLTQQGGTFKQVALIEFPGPGLWSVVFVAAPASGEIQEKLGKDGRQLIGIFLPSVPPTAGYVVYMDRKDVLMLDMSVEDAAKLLLSAGLVMPEYQKKTAELAAAAQAPSKSQSGMAPGAGQQPKASAPALTAPKGGPGAPYAPPPPRRPAN
jgi:uncharacterized membrane protein